MKTTAIIPLLTILITLSVKVHATKIAAPADQTISAPGGKFELKINAASGLHEVRSAGDKPATLWSFNHDIWHDDYFLSADGNFVAWVSWSFVKVENLDSPAVIIYSANGEVCKFSYRQLCNPRAYKAGEAGPIGDFWRIWREKPTQDKETITYLLPENKSLSIDLAGGTISVKTSFRK